MESGDFDLSKIEDVLWSLTDACNLKCVYCSVEAGGEAPCSEMPPAGIGRIFAELQTLPNLQSLILSGGEAVLSRHFPEVVERASQLCPNVFVITNGVRVGPAAWRALRMHRPTVMISIDALDERVNALTRGARTLEKSLATLGAVQAMGLTVVVISVVTRANIESIPEGLAQLYEMGVRKVLLQQLHCEGRAGAELYRTLSPPPRLIDELHARIMEFGATHTDAAVDSNEICFFPMRETAYRSKCLAGLAYKPQRLFMCGAAFNFFAIKTNGDVVPCNALRSCVLGNIWRERLGDILVHSDEARNVRRLRTLRTDSIPGCRDCEYSPMCDGGCRADVLHLTGDILAKHPYCEVARR